MTFAPVKAPRSSKSSHFALFLSICDVSTCTYVDICNFLTFEVESFLDADIFLQYLVLNSASTVMSLDVDPKIWETLHISH